MPVGVASSLATRYVAPMMLGDQSSLRRLPFREQARRWQVSVGANVTFQITATGTQPLTYQWHFNESELGGVTNRTLLLTNVQPSTAGGYLVVVSNATGSLTTRVAALSIDASFTKITTGNIATEGGASTACAWGDYDNDGWPDLFVNNRDSRNVLYRNQRDGTFEKITTGHLVTNTGTHLAGVWGDYDNDGFLDLLVVNGGCCAGNQRNVLYHNHGDGTFSQPSAATAGSIVSDAGGFHGAAWGDYDGDGFLDVFVANYTGSNYLYQNVGGTNFGQIAMLGSAGAEAAWADYDNDGFLDLFVANGFYGDGGLDNYLFHNNSDGTFERILTGSLAKDQGHSIGCAWADYDNDGFQDLFVANDPNFDGSPIIPEINFLYCNNGNSNNWLKVRLVGTVSNRSGIGAKVRVKARYAGQDRSQLRQIASSDGRTGGSLEAHFGLGDATIVDTLRIEWPSGGRGCATLLPRGWQVSGANPCQQINPD